MNDEPSSLDERHRHEAMEPDVALPPELEVIAQRLSADSAVWQSRLPDPSAVAERIRAIPLAISHTGEAGEGGKSTMPMQVSVPPEVGHRTQGPDGRPPRLGPQRGLLAALAAALIVGLLAVVLAQFAQQSGKSTGPVGQPTPTQPVPTPPLATPTAMPSATPSPTPFVASPFAAVGEPVVANGLVYVTTHNDYLYALSATDGSVVWRFHGDDASAEGPPTVANSVVYFGALNTCNSSSATPPYLYAINAATGVLVWRVPSIPFFGKLLVADGAIYGGTCESGIGAYRASDGKQLWTGTISGGCYTGSLASDATYLYVSTIACGGVVALRLSDGQAAWQNPNVDGGAPTVVNGTIYVGRYVVRASDGATIRTFPVSNGGTDVVVNGEVFIASDVSLSAWNTSTGAEIWQASADHKLLLGIGNGTIYTGDSHTLNAYQASDGKQVWSTAVDHSYVPENDPLPTSLGNTIYVGTTDGAVVVLRASDGALMWRTTLH